MRLKVIAQCGQFGVNFGQFLASFLREGLLLENGLNFSQPGSSGLLPLGSLRLQGGQLMAQLICAAVRLTQIGLRPLQVGQLRPKFLLALGKCLQNFQIQPVTLSHLFKLL